MKRIKTIEKIVLDILENNLRSREDDFILYGAVLRRVGIDLKNTNLYYFLANAKGKKYPSFETVSRCRRHIQELRQDLCGKVTAIRQDKEVDFKKYNLSGIGEYEKN